MKLSQTTAIVVLSAAIAWATAHFTVVHKESTFTVPEHSHQPAFDRVMKTGVLRCGYGIWAPGFTKDPHTGKPGGIFYDYLEAIGKHTGLKIEWAEEIGWAEYPESLNIGRVDAMCFGAWPRATLARRVMFTRPTYFLPVYAYVREGDTRFDNDATKINSPNIQISTVDAELSSELAASLFPKAKTLSMPQLTEASMLLVNVEMGKADVTFTDAWTGAAFMRANPGKVRRVPLDHPLRMFGHTIPVAQGEVSLLSLLNTATDQIISSGEFDIILQKNSQVPGVLMMEKTQYK